MFNNLGWGEIAVLLVIGMLVVGPERLPKLAADAGRLVRQLRRMATGVTDDLRAELGPDFDTLRDLHPRRILSGAILDDDDRPAPVRPQPALPVGQPAPYDSDAT